MKTYRKHTGLLVLGGLLLTTTAMAQSEIKLKPDDLIAGDAFGNTVALDGDYAIVGAYLLNLTQEPPNDEDYAEEGAAYIYHFDGTTWVEQAKLTEPVPVPKNRFGTSVALQGNYAVVGTNPDQVETTFQPGSVHVFKREGEVWTHQATLHPHDSDPLDGFGFRVALEGNWLLVAGGLSGPYAFERVGEEWIERQSLDPLDTPPLGYGNALAIDGDTALVSASSSLVNPNAVYVFAQKNGVWTQVSKVVVEQAGNRFGIDVALDGETMVAAADKDDDQGTDAGAVYVFTRTDETWTQQAKLYTGDPDPVIHTTDNWSVALHGDTLVLGADRNLDTGVVYRYTRTGSE